jgi:hypothetical protein
MITKTTITLAAAFILATTSGAFAQTGQQRNSYMTVAQASSQTYDHRTNRDQGLQDRSINLSF